MAAYDHGTQVAETRHLVASLVVGLLAGALLVGGVWYSMGRTPAHVQRVTQACTPVSTGGGVVQCANPTLFDSAIVACFDNAQSYIGATTTETFHMLSQCVDDYLANDR